MTLLLLVFFMVEGISKVVFALNIRPFPAWGWVLASGLVGIVLALYLFANLPVTAEWVLGFLLGILLVVGGRRADLSRLAGAHELSGRTPLSPRHARPKCRASGDSG